MRKINTRSFVRATRSTPREINRQIALNLVREHQPISRADLARRMKIGRGMVTYIVGELLEEGAIYEGALVSAPRGRKPRMLYIRTGDRLVVAIDIRFSMTSIMVADFGGNPLAMESFPTITAPGKLVAELSKRIKRLRAAHGSAGVFEGVGLVVPGMVESRTGRVLHAPQLGWRDVEVREQLAAATGLPVHIENAPIACALSHLWLGQHGSDVAGDFVYVTVSDGVGAGVVVNRELVRGHGSTAGEFGHIPLNLDGPTCLCGARGCLETYTSNLATLSRYLGRELSTKGMREALQASGLTIDDVITRALDGEERAIAALTDTARYLGAGLGVIVTALNPSQIFLGGEITRAWELLGPTVHIELGRRALTTTAAATPVIPDLTSFPRLRGATALVAAQQFAAPRVA